MTTSSDKRDRIVQTSLDLIAERGFHGAPMALIAEKAGVGAGTIYRYFESKDVLIIALFQEIKGKIEAFLTKDYDEDKPLREKYIYLCTRLIGYFITFPLHFRFMEQYYHSPFGTSLRRDKFLGKPSERDAFMNLFEQGMSQKILKDFPPYVYAALTFSPLVSLARDHNLDLIKLDDDVILKSIEASWNGIKS